MYRSFLIIVSLISALLLFSIGCTDYRTEEVYARARPGFYVSAKPTLSKTSPEADFRVMVSDDDGVLEKLDVDAGSELFALKLDKWRGKFLRISLQAKGEGAFWKNIKLQTRPDWKARSKSFAGDENDKRPNVIIYLVDALRADALGCYNPESFASPHIDSFARGAVIFKRGYSPSSWTRPSVASLFTGTCPPHHGAVGRRGGLSERLDTLAGVLKRAGWRTEGYVTNGNVAPELGFGRGFDRYVYYPEDPGDEDVYSSSEGLLEKIGPSLKKLEGPFFLYIHQSDPHAPYTPPSGLAEKFMPSAAQPISGGMEVFRKLVYRAITPSRAQVDYLHGLYRAEVAAADAGFHKFLELLKKKGFYENSLIFFVADHGEEFYEHRGFGHGGTLYEEQVRAPLIMRCPGGGASKSVRTPVSIVDVPATVLDSLGIDKPEHMSGRNLTAIAGSEDSLTPAPLYMHEVLDKVEKEAVLDWPMKLVHNTNRTNQWGDRVVEWEMYDLSRDPAERRPISTGRGITREVLKNELERLRGQYSPPLDAGEAQISTELKKRLEALGY